MANKSVQVTFPSTTGAEYIYTQQQRVSIVYVSVQSYDLGNPILGKGSNHKTEENLLLLATASTGYPSQETRVMGSRSVKAIFPLAATTWMVVEYIYM